MNYAQLVAAIEDYVADEFDTTSVDTFIQQAEQRIYNSVQLAYLRKNVTGGLTKGNKYLSCPSDFLSTYSLAVFTFADPTATGAIDETTITVSSANNIEVGQRVTGTGIGIDAVVEEIDGTTITLSVENAGAVSGTVTFQGDYEYLLNKDSNYIREVYPSATAQGLPKYYGIFGPTVISSVSTNELSLIIGPTPNKNYGVEMHYFFYPQTIVSAGTTWLGDNFDSVLLYGSLVEAYTYMKGEPDIMAIYETKYKEALMLLKQLGDGKERGDAYRDGQVKYPVK